MFSNISALKVFFKSRGAAGVADVRRLRRLLRIKADIDEEGGALLHSTPAASLPSFTS